MENSGIFKVEDRFAVAAQGWCIIRDNPLPRRGARELCRFLAKALRASAVGLEFHNSEGYAWREQAEFFGNNTTNGVWERPFPQGRSRWYFNGGQQTIPGIEQVLDVLTDQWLHRGKIYPQKNTRIADTVPSHGNSAWIAVSVQSRRVLSLLPELYQSSRPLLLIGEPGSGRRYIARLIHSNGPYPFSPFSAPENQQQEEAQTCFVADWDLRCPEEQIALQQCSGRLIAAANAGNTAQKAQISWRLITGGRGMILYVPSLRDRLADIPLLASQFLRSAALMLDRRIPDIEPFALNLLKSYHWPGNTRELREAITAGLMAMDMEQSLLKAEHLPAAIRGAGTLSGHFPQYLMQLERNVLLNELKLQHGNVTHTARKLGLTPRQVTWRLKKYGIEPRSCRPGWIALPSGLT
ncbi:MAG: hypothetical protein B0D92_06615 [Spirochaeta sp. LUC14_002_19_P3]|nr:MAG: hypothetical protein B0D92_06615 [Spirochaeta sp. LUC14_002_19_P3]